MFCATFLKFAAVLFLETTQSDQSGFRMNVGNQFPRWKELHCRATFSARQKVLNQNLIIFLILYWGFS